jgi:hypothetical protein
MPFDSRARGDPTGDDVRELCVVAAGFHVEEAVAIEIHGEWAAVAGDGRDRVNGEPADLAAVRERRQRHGGRAGVQYEIALRVTGGGYAASCKFNVAAVGYSRWPCWPWRSLRSGCTGASVGGITAAVADLSPAVVVPFGQLVPASWSTNAWLPLTSALVQQPWITPDESIGLPAMAAPPAVPRRLTPGRSPSGGVVVMTA